MANWRFRAWTSKTCNGLGNFFFFFFFEAMFLRNAVKSPTFPRIPLLLAIPTIALGLIALATRDWINLTADVSSSDVSSAGCCGHFRLEFRFGLTGLCSSLNVVWMQNSSSAAAVGLPGPWNIDDGYAAVVRLVKERRDAVGSDVVDRNVSTALVAFFSAAVSNLQQQEQSAQTSLGLLAVALATCLLGAIVLLVIAGLQLLPSTTTAVTATPGTKSSRHPLPPLQQGLQLSSLVLAKMRQETALLRLAEVCMGLSSLFALGAVIVFAVTSPSDSDWKSVADSLLSLMRMIMMMALSLPSQSSAPMAGKASVDYELGVSSFVAVGFHVTSLASCVLCEILVRRLRRLRLNAVDPERRALVSASAYASARGTTQLGL